MKQEAVKLSGSVVELLPNAMFRVQIEGMSSPVLAYIGGKMRYNDINISLGDIVDIEFSPYDLSRGRIVYRNK